MSSAITELAYTKQGNDYFVNLSTLNNNSTGNLFAYDGTTFSASTMPGVVAVVNPGTLLVKDMGKIVYASSGDVYRKVQTLTANAGTDTTFYIKSVPASGSASVFARMTLQNI